MEKYTDLQSEYTQEDMVAILTREINIRRGLYLRAVEAKDGTKAVKWRRKCNRMIQVHNCFFVTAEESMAFIEFKQHRKDVPQFNYLSILRDIQAEVDMREQVYAERVRQGRMKPQEARYQFDGMKAVFNFVYDKGGAAQAIARQGDLFKG